MISSGTNKPGIDKLASRVKFWRSRQYNTVGFCEEMRRVVKQFFESYNPRHSQLHQYAAETIQQLVRRLVQASKKQSNRETL